MNRSPSGRLKIHMKIQKKKFEKVQYQIESTNESHHFVACLDWSIQFPKKSGGKIQERTGQLSIDLVEHLWQESTKLI